MRPLILGSTSRYRRELLSRLQLPFETVSPEVDETPLSGETPYDLSLRLARAKAQAVALIHPGAIVIGSDQVPELDGQPLSKPGTHERATEQLRQMSGRQMNFHTGVCVTCAETGFAESSVVTVPNSPMTAQALPRAKAWALHCWTPSSATTPRP